MNTSSGTTSRAVRDDEDFWRVRSLLIRIQRAAPAGHNWDVRRWDSKYFYNPSGRWEDGWEQCVRLWETQSGDLVGCVNREGPGDAWIQVDPAYRCLEGEMIEWAEASLAAPVSGGESSGPAELSLEFLVFEYDVLRQGLLAERGYEKGADGGMFRHMALPAPPLPGAGLAAPYCLRQVGPADPADCQRIAELLNAAFRRTFHNGPEFASFARLAPCYVNELDLVAVAPDGSFAAYAGMPYDRDNRVAIFEPVCTHPAHLRKGLAGGLMREALHRVQAMGAVDATVETGDMIPANALYDSLGFTEAYRASAWRKRWPE
jgi:mycothiol synthase